MNDDELFDFSNKQPEKDYFDVYEVNGNMIYYYRTYMQYIKYTALYGKPNIGLWSYTNKNAFQTY